jgi:hypothetical protein
VGIAKWIMHRHRLLGESHTLRWTSGTWAPVLLENSRLASSDLLGVALEFLSATFRLELVDPTTLPMPGFALPAAIRKRPSALSFRSQRVAARQFQPYD